MSFPSLFHRELGARVRAVAQRLKRSVVQDNSISQECKSIARCGWHSPARAGGNQTATQEPLSHNLVWGKGTLEKKKNISWMTGQ